MKSGALLVAMEMHVGAEGEWSNQYEVRSHDASTPKTQ